MAEPPIRRVFVTGGEGFVGKHLMRVARRRGLDLVLLQRPGADLRDPRSYAKSLSGTEAVVHLAAATGAASERDHAAVNAEGTRGLVEAARAAGVKRFLLVSTIAAKFADTSRYPYARSKQEAEAAVSASRLRTAIVRPTIVLGSGSAVLAGLRRLAAFPVVPIFGAGTARVQPIDVNDLAIVLDAILAEDRFDGGILEAGGRDVVSMEELITTIRAIASSKTPRVVHLPYRPISAVLWGLERSGLRLPVTAGQLASFAEDGTIEPSEFLKRVLPRPVPLADALRHAFAGSAS